MRRQLISVAFLTALSQAMAFFKLWFVARQFGIGSEMDAYNLALVAPTFIAGILSGLIQTGFFPVRSAYKVESADDSLALFERSVFWVVVAIGAAASLLVFLASDGLSERLGGPDQGATIDVVRSILPFLAALIVLNVATDVMGYLLAMHGRYPFAAAAPILNGLIGALVLVLWPEYGLWSLVAGTILGVIGQLFICLLGLKSIGFVFLGPLQAWSEFVPLGKRMLVLSAWILPGVIVSNITASLPMVWAAQFGEGAASAFGYAYRLHTSAVQLLIMASSTLILAHFSALVANGDADTVRRFLWNAAALSFGLGVAAWLAVVTLGQPILTGIFGGRFDGSAAGRVSGMWAWLTVGIAFTLLGNVFAKLWQAQGRAKLMSVMSIIGLGVAYAVFFMFRDMLEENSIALALSLASASIVLIGIFFIRRKREFSA